MKEDIDYLYAEITRALQNANPSEAESHIWSLENFFEKEAKTPKFLALKKECIEQLYILIKQNLDDKNWREAQTLAQSYSLLQKDERLETLESAIACLKEEENKLKKETKKVQKGEKSKNSPKKQGKLGTVVVFAFGLLLILFLIFTLYPKTVTQKELSPSAYQGLIKDIETDKNSHIITIDLAKKSVFFWKEYNDQLYKYDIDSKKVISINLNYDNAPFFIYSISEAFEGKTKDEIILICDSGGIGESAGYHALKYNIIKNTIIKLCSGRKIERSGNLLMAERLKLIKEGRFAAENVYDCYEFYYDFNGHEIKHNRQEIKEYLGNIGKYPIQMYLNHNRKQGHYRYTSNKSLDFLNLEISTQVNNCIEMQETNNRGEVTGYFIGKFNNGCYYGTFTNKKGQKYSFKIKEKRMR